MVRRVVFVLIGLFLHGTAFAADSNTSESAWLSAALYGNDNDVAALKKIEIFRSKGNYRIYIQNQFGFECDLLFDDADNLASLSNCVSQQEDSPVCNPKMPNSSCAIAHNCFRKPNETNPDCFYQWRVKESHIPLRCSKTRNEHICKGSYTLTSTRNYSEPSEFTIARRLK